MYGTNQPLAAASDFSRQPLTWADFERLALRPSTMERIQMLLEEEANGTISPLEYPELVTYKEAAYSLRLGENTQ